MRFQHVFYPLLVVCALVAFLVPQKYSESGRPMVGALLSPVSRPVRAVASFASNRVSPPVRDDKRVAGDVLAENDVLRGENVRLAAQVERLRVLAAQHEQYGARKDDMTRVAVAGTAPGRGEALIVQGSSMTGLKHGSAALYNRDVVGVLVSGRAGTVVRLVTDPQSRVKAYFGKYGDAGLAADGTPKPRLQRMDRIGTRIIEGAGDNRMLCRNVAMADAKAAGLTPGDWVVLDETEEGLKEWRDSRIGIVYEVREGENLMAEIEIRPAETLLRLQDLMVLTKEKKK